MSRAFNLTAELNLRGPANIRPIIANIRRQLSGITANVNVNINNNTARNVNTLQQSITRLNTSLNTTQTSARNAAAALTALGRAAAVTNNNIGNIPRNLNRINTGAANTNNALTQTNNALNQAAGGFEEFGRQSALAVRRFAAFATVTGVIYRFTNAISSATTEFIDFNRELVRVAQVTDSSLSQLSPLVGEITRLSTSLGIASKDLISVSSTLAQAGLSAKDTEKALRALALSALAPSFDSLSDTVEGSIALMRQFGISAGELEDALGSVNSVAAKFAVEASDLITAIQRTGGVFATASKGVSQGKDALNEFLAVFTSVRATTRESAETIATGLRTIFTRIQRGDTIKALREYGVVLTDLEGKFVGPYEAVRRLSEGLSKLDPRDLRFSQIVEELGGFRQIGKVIPLIQQFATAQAALKVAQQGQGSLAKDAATAQLSLSNQISKVREEFTALIRSLGESSTFQTFVRLSLDLASALIRLADSAKTVLPALTAIAAFRGVSALTRFGAGFAGGLRRQNNGGFIRGFATGGVVPGEGNSDTFPAMLTPGEFVIRKKAVQAIGINKLHKMNRFAKGGSAKAPMVDDITANAKGAILPNKIALEKILASGYGALDFDRTLKRTVGDQAYGKAKTTGQKDAVLSKYFRDPTTRLADAKSARLTQFGRMLQKSIQGGKVNPANLSIISKSGRTPGLAEYINELFGIPIGNMIFTGGGSKEGAYKAFQNKGPRAQRVARFAGGGLIDDIKAGNKTVGAAILEAGPARQAEFLLSPKSLEKAVGKPLKNLPTLGKFNAPRVGLSSNTSGAFNNALDEGIVRGVNYASRLLAKDLGMGDVAKIGKGDKQAFLSGINDATRGNLFEDVLLSMRGGPFAERESQQPFDFPNGLGGVLSDDFVGLPPKWVDAKASFKTAQITGSGSLRAKTIRQLANEIRKNPSLYIDNEAKTASKIQQEAQEKTQAAPPTLAGNSNLQKFERDKPYTTGELKAQGFATVSDRNRNFSKTGTKWFRKAMGGFIQKFAVGGEAQAIADKLGKGKSRTWWTGQAYGKQLLTDTSLAGVWDAVTGQLVKLDPMQGKMLREMAMREQASARPQTTLKQESEADLKARLEQERKTAGDAAIARAKSMSANADKSMIEIEEKNKTKKIRESIRYQANEVRAATRDYRYMQRRKKFAVGGGVGTDTVPALLTPGEFVINRKAASRIGASRLHQLNRADKIQGFNKGGAVGGVQKLNSGGLLQSTLAGMSPKDSARLGASITRNAQAFEQLERMVTDWPAEDIAMAMKKLDRSLEKGASTADALSSAVGAGVGGAGSERTPKKGVLQQTAGVSESRNITAPVGPTGFAASQARINQIAGNVGQYQRGQDVVDRRNTPMGMSSTSNMSNAGLQFAASLKNATTPLQTLTQAAKNAGTGLLQVGKSSVMAAGRGAGGLISSIGGGVLNSIGLGRFGSRGARGGGGAGGAGGAGDGGGGGGFGMAGMALTMVGGMGVEALSNAMGGEKTESGRTISAVGGSVANMASIGATVGSLFGPIGTGVGAAAGALAGFVMGLGDAKKANEEYAQSQKVAASQAATEKSGKALQAYMSKPGGAQKLAFFKSFNEASSVEAAAGEGIKRQRASGFGKMLGYQDETTADLGKRRAETQKAGAEQAQQFLEAEMMRTGKTFDEVSKSMSPAQFKTLTSNIAEADEKYAAFQLQRADEIKKLRDSGRGAEADAVQAQTNKDLAAMAENISRRATAEAGAAAQAKAAAEASKKLQVVMMQAVVSLEKSFNALDEVLNKSSFDLGQISGKADEIFSGKASLTSSTFAKTNNVLQNPNAYSAAERQAAISSSASRMGPTGQLVGRVAEFGARATEKATREANAVYNAGGSNAEVGASVTRNLTNDILATFGPNSSMAQTLINGVRETVDKAVEEAGDSSIDPAELIDKATGPLNKAAQQAGQLLIKNNENVAKHLEELGKVAERVVEIEQRRVDRTAALVEMQAQSGLATKEALGQKVSIGERINARFAGNRARLGIKNQGDFTPQNIANMRANAQKEQQALQAQIDKKSAETATNPGAAREVANLQLKLAKVNSTIDKTSKELEDLPASLEGAISDVTSEIQKRVAQLEAQKQAGSAFAEKLVGSTPQELMELNQTFNLLNNTLRGQLTTIYQSQAAQKAYVQAIKEGKTAQEAMTDAQAAYANENKKALSLFGELTQIAGIEGPELDVMKADLLEGFARAQGTGLDQNPFFQKILATLRQDPAERAKDDPVLLALVDRMETLKQAQVDAVRLQNENDRTIQKDLLEKVGKGILDSLAETQRAFVAAMNDIARRMGAAPPQLRANGGLIYAANGQYINFQPKGTDTVPAMLTPGEFVINAKSTRENLGLLTAINNSKGGRINYLAVGGQADLSGVSQRSATARQEDMTRSGLINQTTLGNKLDTVKTLSQNINNTTLTTKNNQIPSLDSSIGNSQDSNNKQFLLLNKNINNLSNSINSQKFNTGGMVYASDGQYINFQPKGTDTIPAMLTPGEFVVNAQSTKDNLGLLQAINSGYYATGGEIPSRSPNDLLRGVSGNLQYRMSLLKQSGKYWILNRKNKQRVDQEGKMRFGGVERDQSAYVEQAKDVTDAARIARNKYNWFDENITQYQLIAEQNEAFKAYKKASPSEKITIELFQQMKDAPELFGKDAFNINVKEKEDNIRQKLDSGQNPGELYRKATKRQNYLYRVRANVEAALKIFDKEMTPNRNAIEILRGQYFGSEKEINLIDKVWNRLMAEKKLSGLQRDQTSIFNEFNPKNLPNKDYYNKGGVVYAEDGSYIPFKTPRAKALNDRRIQGEKVQEEKQKAAMLDRLRKQINAQLAPTDNRAMFELQQRLRASGYLEGKKQRKDAVIDDEEYEQIKFALDMIDEYKRFQYSQIPVNNKFNSEEEKTRRRNTPQLPPTLPHLTPKSKQYGGVVYANSGTLVPYQPMGTDTVPAMLTPGEFVVNRQASQKHLGLLQAINNGYYSKGGVAYLATGTPGTSVLDSNMTYLSDMLKKGADNLNLAFVNAVKKLNNITENNPEIGQVQTNGVSNNQINPSVSIEALGNRLDRFIEQLHNAIPSTVRLEVPTPIPVNVTINGASVLADVLNGPLGTLVQRAIKDAFDQKSRQNEGY